MGAFRPELILVPVVGCPLASRLLSGDRRFDDVAWISFAAWLNAYYARRLGTLAR